ncbi:hypothetical protein [Bombella mellum]|nr:hypothetical protein [Bombella mellum]
MKFLCEHWHHLVPSLLDPVTRYPAPLFPSSLRNGRAFRVR